MYKVQVYVDHGYYEYEVKEMASAMAHAQAIMATGVYRRVNSGGDVEFFRAYKVKVRGEGLATQYSDVFVRT